MYDNYYSDYDSLYYSSGLLTILGFVYITLAISLYVLTGFALMKIFKKAGLPGWRAWVPIYNVWTLFELGGYNGAWSLLIIPLAIPLIGIIPGIAWIVFYFSALAEIHKKIGKNPLGFNLLNLFFEPIWCIVILASDFNWNDSLGKPSLAEGTILGYTTETVYVQTAQPATTTETSTPEAVTEDSNTTNL